MLSQTKIYKGRVIQPEQGKIYPTMALGQAQELRVLQAYVEGAMERIAIALGPFLRSVGCIRVEPGELAFRELSAVEQEQGIWCAAVAPLGNRASKLFRFGVHHVAATTMTAATLGLASGGRFDTLGGQPPSETERRFLSRLGDVLTQGAIADNSDLQALDWQLQPSDPPGKKGLCLTMQLVFQDHSWPLTLHWHMAFARLLTRLSDREQTASPIDRAQLAASLEKVPVQLKTTLLNTRLTMAELEQLLQGEILTIAPLERMTLGCGNFSMGSGQLYDRNGHLVFQLNEVSQQTP